MFEKAPANHSHSTLIISRNICLLNIFININIYEIYIAEVIFFIILIFVIVYLYVTAISYAITSLMPRIMDIVFPLNTSRPVMFLWPAYYFVDEEKYYYYIYCDMLIILMTCLAALIAHDSMFFVYIEHACGLFAAIG